MRDRLREKIRAKRERRLGGAESSVEKEEESAPRLGANLGAEKRRELSCKVEAELKRIFGCDPEAMKIAQTFIDDPLSVLTSSTDETVVPEETRRTYEQLLGMEAVDEDEAPPSRG